MDNKEWSVWDDKDESIRISWAVNNAVQVTIAEKKQFEPKHFDTLVKYFLNYFWEIKKAEFEKRIKKSEIIKEGIDDIENEEANYD